MGRIWLTVILPLLLPTLLYVLWSVAMPHSGGGRRLQQTWPWLVVTGVALSGGVLVAAWLRAGSGGAGSDSYVPPHVIDGQVVPGRLAPPEAPAR